MKVSTGYTPLQIINVIRFYSAFLELQRGKSIEDTLYLIRIDSKSYFYKLFKKLHKIKPSEVERISNNLTEIAGLDRKGSLSCNIERYKYYKANLNDELAHLFSHEDFKDITCNNISLKIVSDIFWRYKHLNDTVGNSRMTTILDDYNLR
jgi:AraC-like DNA-binding protein